MIAGIICEYNPFHNGHLYQLNKTRESGAEFIVCAMSGNFVQRGECAFLDKWKRAEIAVMNGADVVIDLPTPWACSSAENFARGAVSMLANFGIDVLSFGCENDDSALLKECAEACKNPAVFEKAKEYMKDGETYPSALCRAVKELYSKAVGDVMNSPNNTLAVEYIKAINELQAEIDILPVKRVAVSHDSDDYTDSFMSASAIRKIDSIEKAFDFLPENSLEMIRKSSDNGEMPCSMKNIERSVIADIRRMSIKEMEKFVSDENGPAQRIGKSIKNCESLNELYDSVKSKNYTHSRIRREILNLYLKIEKNISFGLPPYIRILAVSERGLSLLSKAQKNSCVPIITKHSEMEKLNEDAKKIYEIQCRSTDIFALCSKKIRACSLEQTHSMKIVR